MATLYFGFGLSDAMFSGDVEVTRKQLSMDGEYIQYLLDNPSAVFAEETVLCLNPSHKATINAMNNKFGIHVEIPEIARQIALSSGDSLIVMSPRGLPRLVDRHEYSEEEIAQATFSFALWSVK